jgi:hypothetical protein
MFPSQKSRFSTLFRRSIDAAIDFATLGEYGLEPVGRPAAPCEARRRPGSLRSTGSWSSAVNRFAAHS